MWPVVYRYLVTYLSGYFWATGDMAAAVCFSLIAAACFVADLVELAAA